MSIPTTSNGRIGISELIVTNMMREIVKNATTRTRFPTSGEDDLDPRRSINDECGYPRTDTLTVEHYRDLYDREAIAARVVGVLPQESWMVQPAVFEDDDVDSDTEFEKSWDELGKSLGGSGWFKREEGSIIWEYLRRADTLSGIGSYGVMLLGLADGRELHEPAKGTDEAGKKVGNAKNDLLFLRVFDESIAQITQSEEDKTNPRFGQPTQYLLTLNDPRDTSQAGQGLTTGTVNVHWSRVIHFADNLGSSETFGVPRQRPVLNNILNLRKLYGGSAEMYWKGAFPGISWETHPQLGGDVSVNVSDLRSNMENWWNGLQRGMVSKGMTAKSLAPQVVDPTAQIDAQLEAICIKIGVPKRILLGSERGELASSQDVKTWNKRLSNRQESYLTPRVIVPFVDRLIMLGVLPEPKEYNTVWPDLASLSEDEQATIAQKRTEAMAKYVQGGVDALIAPIDYLTRELGYTEEEAGVILATTLGHVEETEEHDIELRAQEQDEELDKAEKMVVIDGKNELPIPQKIS